MLIKVLLIRLKMTTWFRKSILLPLFHAKWNLMKVRNVKIKGKTQFPLHASTSLIRLTQWGKKPDRLTKTIIKCKCFCCESPYRTFNSNCKLQTCSVFFLVSPTLMCYLWLRMTSDAHNSISQKLESQQKRMSRVNKNGKCSFVLERQHTNLHLFNDLFVSSESYLFARIHSLSLLRLSFLAFLSNHSPYHLFSFLSFSIVIDKWHLIYFIFVNFAFGFVLRGDEDFLHDFVAFQVFNAFKCSHRKIRRKWKIILII